MKDKLSKNEYRLLVAILLIIDFIVTGCTFMYLWNNVIAHYLGLTNISFWQSQAFSIIIFFLSSRQEIGDYDEELFYNIKKSLLTFIVTFLMIKFGLI